MLVRDLRCSANSTNNLAVDFNSQCFQICGAGRISPCSQWTIFKKLLSNVPTSVLVLIVQNPEVAPPVGVSVPGCSCEISLFSSCSPFSGECVGILYCQFQIWAERLYLRWLSSLVTRSYYVRDESSGGFHFFFLWSPFGISINFLRLVRWELNNLVEWSVPEFVDPEYDLQLFFLSFSCMSCELLPYWGKENRTSVWETVVTSTWFHLVGVHLSSWKFVDISLLAQFLHYSTRYQLQTVPGYGYFFIKTSLELWNYIPNQYQFHFTMIIRYATSYLGEVLSSSRGSLVDDW